MNPDAQRIALAEWELEKILIKGGYEPYQRPEGERGYRCDLSGLWIYRNAQGQFYSSNYHSPKQLRDGSIQALIEQRKCYDSLDDIHRIEERLTDEELWEAIKFLVNWTPSPSGFPLLSRSESIKLARATPGEWRPAILRALNLWEEEVQR